MKGKSKGMCWVLFWQAPLASLWAFSSLCWVTPVSVSEGFYFENGENVTTQFWQPVWNMHKSLAGRDRLLEETALNPLKQIIVVVPPLIYLFNMLSSVLTSVLHEFFAKWEQKELRWPFYIQTEYFKKLNYYSVPWEGNWYFILEALMQCILSNILSGLKWSQFIILDITHLTRRNKMSEDGWNRITLEPRLTKRC